METAYTIRQPRVRQETPKSKSVSFTVPVAVACPAHGVADNAVAGLVEAVYTAARHVLGRGGPRGARSVGHGRVPLVHIDPCECRHNNAQSAIRIAVVWLMLTDTKSHSVPACNLLMGQS
jgi:hypothetical protein